MPNSSQRILKADGTYLAVLDLASEVNRSGSFAETMTRARTKALADGVPLLSQLNEELARQASSAIVQYWPLSLDGVYMVRLVVSEHEPSLSPHMEIESFVAHDSMRSTLSCPTGQIAVANPVEFGTDQVWPILDVAPGEYAVSLTVDWDAVGRHQCMSAVDDYDASSGPDFIVHLVCLTESRRPRTRRAG